MNDRDYERYFWLGAIADYLSPPGKEILQGLQQTYGAIEDAQLNSDVRFTEAFLVQHVTPVKSETIRQWSVGEIARYCLAFTGPEESFDKASKEGLAELIVTEARERPLEFSADAKEFVALEDEINMRENPRYLAAIFRGLHQAVRGQIPEEGDSKDLGNTIIGVLSPSLTQLICWVATRNSVERNWRVPTWESAKREAADLLLLTLECMFKLPPSDVGQLLGRNQQGILEALVALQNSDAPFEEIDDDDPLIRCINSTRGRTLHAVVAFQASLDNWARSASPEEQGPRKFNPDVSNLFDQLLEGERSPAVRCVFGWKLPYLHRLDSEWVENHLEDIFPIDELDYPIWRATWDAYVGFNPLYTSIWELLKSQYRYAVARVGRRQYARFGSHNPDENLGDHIFMAWFSNIENAESILAFYLASSDDVLRSQLVWFASRVLENNVSSKGLSADSNEWGKLERFWSERINQKGPIGVVACEAKEAGAFVRWLTLSPVSLPRLKPLIDGIVMRLSEEDQTWEATSLLEYLCSQSEEYPVAAAQIILAIAKEAWPQWLSGEQRAGIFAALRRALTETGGEELVKEIVAQLSLRHYYEYRGILEEGANES